MAVTLKTTDEINKMRQAGQIAAQVQSILRTHAVPGTTTRELDLLADEYLRQHGAKRHLTRFYSPHTMSTSGFAFPPTMYISLNDEILNGMPSTYPLRQGDVVKLDITVGLNDWWATTAMTVPVGQIDREARRLLQTTEYALSQGIAAARTGNRLQDISQAIQQPVEAAGFSVVREYYGCGIGRMPHEDPAVPGYIGPMLSSLVLRPGMVFYIVAIVNAGSAAIERGEKSVFTADGSLSAMCGHTVAITKEGTDILTK